MHNNKVDFSQFPDQRGHFGRYGGRFVAETLMEALHELDKAWQNYRNDPEFLAELDADSAHYVGRPTPLYHAEHWSQRLGGAQMCIRDSPQAGRGSADP